MANRTASARMTSIALSPRSRASVHSRFGSSIRLPRRGNDAVALGASPRQFLLQPLGFLFQSHPAQFANALDQVVRPRLAFREIVWRWVFERHWHDYPPASFLFVGLPAARYATISRRNLRLPNDRAPLARDNRAGLARLLASACWLACARVQACAATYCGGKLTSRSRSREPRSVAACRPALCAMWRQ